MLDRIWKHRWKIAAALVLWFVFETFVSWGTFCHQANQYGAGYHPAPENNCEFRGPLISFVRVFLRWWGHTFDKPDEYVALFTAVLAVCTLALWWSTRKLWRVTDETLRHAERTGERQLRAYVSVFEAHFTRFGQLGGDFVVNYRNTGQSPAHDVESQIGVTFTDFPLTETLGMAPEGTLSKTVLGPNVQGHTELRPPRALTPQELGRIADGSAAVFVHGQITYKDIFGRSWETHYRYYVGGDVGVNAGESGHMAAHAEGNTAT